jgi:hypothetical protein
VYKNHLLITGIEVRKERACAGRKCVNSAGCRESTILTTKKKKKKRETAG